MWVIFQKEWVERISKGHTDVWSFAQRLPGESLGAAWTIAPRRVGFNSTETGESEAGLARLAKGGILTAAEIRVLQQAPFTGTGHGRLSSIPGASLDPNGSRLRLNLRLLPFFLTA